MWVSSRNVSNLVVREQGDQGDQGAAGGDHPAGGSRKVQVDGGWSLLGSNGCKVTGGGRERERWHGPRDDHSHI